MIVKSGRREYKGTAKKIVYQMWIHSFDEVDSKDEYMQEINNRVKAMYRREVKTENYINFLRSLHNIGLIKIIED